MDKLNCMRVYSATLNETLCCSWQRNKDRTKSGGWPIFVGSMKNRVGVYKLKHTETTEYSYTNYHAEQPTPFKIKAL